MCFVNQKIYSYLLLVAYIFLTGIRADAQLTEKGRDQSYILGPSSSLNNNQPYASWIWDSGDANPENYYLFVRKTLNLDEAPNRVEAFISAYSFADVYINGELLDRCPVNSDPEYQVYEKYDLTRFFKKGENIISALVYNYGCGTPHRINARGGFFFQAELDFPTKKKLQLNTDDTWLVNKAEAWDNESGYRWEKGRLIGFFEKFDARKYEKNWKEYDFDDSKWERAIELGIPPISPWNNIVEVKRPPLFREVVSPVTHWMKGNKLIYDFGKELCGRPILKLTSSEAGISFEIGTAERLYPDSTANYKERVDFTDYYTCCRGVLEWSPVTWRGFRYLSISLKEGVEILDILSTNQHYNFTHEADFECSDELLNAIWKVGEESLFLCSQDTYMDTPWREQTQYIAGDSRFNQHYAFYSFGLSSEILGRYNILSGAWSQRWRNDGAIRTRYPTDYKIEGNTSAYLPDYQLEWILMLGEFYRYFEKDNLPRQVYPELKKLLEYFETFVGEEHGLLKDLPGWIVLDHPDTYPMELNSEITGLNCLYYGALLQASFIADKLLNDQTQADMWKEQAGVLKQNINKWLWDNNKKAFKDSYGSDKFSQPAQVYALYYNVANEDRTPFLIDAIVEAGRNCEQSFSYYMLSSIFEDRPQWALDFIRKNWGDQMKSQYFNGSWHEAWDIANWPGELGSTSHSWCSGPTALLPQKVLGVEPGEKGWEKFTVKPQFGDLKWAKGTINTPRGEVKVSWNVEKNNKKSLCIDVPNHSIAEVKLPNQRFEDIHLNGFPIKENKNILSVHKGEGAIKLELVTGKYHFDMKN